MSQIARPILKIREVIKDLKLDARTEKVPQAVLKRFVHCVDNITDIRLESLVDYPLPYVLLVGFLAYFQEQIHG